VTVLLLLVGCHPKAPESTITLGGDLMLAREGQAIFQQAGGPIDPWKPLVDQGIIEAPDRNEQEIFMANLESPLGNQVGESNDMNLCSDPSGIEILKEGHINLVTLANNHSDDCNTGGSGETLKLLGQEGLNSVGMGEEPLLIDAPWGRLAIVAGEDITGSMNEQNFLAAIRSARKLANLVIVSIHWGVEYQAGTTGRQQELARRMADAGADVIWGHHPHVLQHMEWIKSEDGREVLVLYSLGNLLSDQWMLEDTGRSVLVRLSIDHSSIKGVEIIPIRMDRASKTLMIDPDQDYFEKRLQLDSLAENGMKISLFSEP